MLLSRISPRVASLAARQQRTPAVLCTSARRMLSEGTHDDFKPKVKRAYADEAGDVHAQIKEDIEENTVVVYMKGVPDAPMCGFSNAVVQVMKAEGVEFKAFNVLADPDLREGIKSFSSWPTIPQLYVKGEFIGGCDITVRSHAFRAPIYCVPASSDLTRHPSCRVFVSRSKCTSPGSFATF